MKGIVFTVLAEVITESHGARVWDRLLDDAGLDGAYTAVGSYDDGEMERLVAAAGSLLELDRETVLRWFGIHAIPRFHARYPHIFAEYVSAKALLLALNDVIHPQVRKLFPGAYAPEFAYAEIDVHTLSLEYRSTRMLCSFAEGLVLGAAAHYGDDVTVTHATCCRTGDERCVIVCDFAPARALADVGG